MKMNKEDIIRMAREACLPGYPDELDRFAALVAAAERAEMAEHCVEITRMAVDKAVDGAIALEREAVLDLVDDYAKGNSDLRDAIRARNKE